MPRAKAAETATRDKASFAVADWSTADLSADGFSLGRECVVEAPEAEAAPPDEPLPVPGRDVAVFSVRDAKVVLRT